MIDLTLLQTIFDKQKGRVKYLLGAKAPSLDCDSNDIQKIDCSGESRYLLARASAQALILPEGSQNQLAFARQHWHRLAKYSDVTFAEKDPSRLFIGFLKPKEGNAWPRHVWLLRSNGTEMVTMESHGSGGVNSRPWNTKALRGCVDVFEVPLG